MGLFSRSRKRQKESTLEPVEDEKPVITPEPILKLPQWFLENCVHTAEELEHRDIPLVVKPGNLSTEDTDARPTTDETDHYEVERMLYQPLLDLVSPKISWSDTDSDLTAGGDKVFLNDAVRLRYPDGFDDQGSTRFWTAVVECFAQQIHADLVTLDTSILADLEEYLGIDPGTVTPAAIGTLLTSADLKRDESGTQRGLSHRRPTILHLPEADMLFYRYNYLESLRTALNVSDRDILTVYTTFEPVADRRKIELIGSRVRKHAVIVAPIYNAAQKALFQKHRTMYDSVEQENIKLLKRSIRKSHPRYRDVNMLSPFTKWEFLEGTTAQPFFALQELKQADLDELLCAMNRDLDEDELKEKILTMAHRKAVLEAWEAPTSSGLEEPKRKRWSSFPFKAQAKIAEIENAYGKYEWEKQFLNLLVNPEDMGEGWSDIAIDPDTQSHIMKLIHQPSKSDSAARGILKRERVGGALLYGPPGTGKTHLARVLARESNVTMICATPADLENMYVGETEKAVQGLFNLGRLLAPSVIFIDEADALFRTRNPQDRSWDRNKLNQLLNEMDGLKKNTSQAFVLLATNFPQDLDNAVLRRVPGRIHIGLPNLAQRAQIIRICLRDEIVDSAVDFQVLAGRTMGFSGSDIQALCVQCALLCDTSTDVESDRILTSSAFDKALSRCSPTVSKKALAEIKAFAKVYDSRALDEMEKRESEDGKRGFAQARNGLTVIETANNNSQQSQAIRVGEMIALRDNLAVTETDSSKREDENGETAQTSAKFHYTPLQPNSKQVRVLSVEDTTAVPGEQGDDPLRCTLKTVDLGDWTSEYRRFIIATKDLNLSHTSRLGYWQTLSEVRRRLLSLDSQSVDNGDIMEWFSSLSSSPYMDVTRDIPFKADADTRPRYNWGEYVALSYVWGDASNRRDIILNGQRFSITSSLYDALLSFRDSQQASAGEMHIWADAICINQEDLHERAVEVKKMSLVYSNSFEVRAWLGHPTNDIDSHAMEVVLNIVADTETDGKFREVIEQKGLRQCIQVVVTALTAQPFWRRTWIVQEIALAPSTIFCYGKSTFSLRALQKLFVGSRLGDETFKLAESSWASPEDFGDILIRMFHVVQFLHFLLVERVVDDESQGSDRRLHTLLTMAQFSRATDPRDKVYGFLSLLPEPIAAQIQPDYGPSSTAQQVFVAFSKACFKAAGDLDVFRFLDRQPASNFEGLPSWALNMYSGYEHARPRFRPLFNAPKPQANLRLVSSQIDYSTSDHLMYCDGVIVDEMDSVGPYMTVDSRTGITSRGDLLKGTSIATAGADQDWQLSLVRALLRDPLFTFSGRVSIFDLPWTEIERAVEQQPSFPNHDHPLWEASNQNMEMPGPSRALRVWEQLLPWLEGNKDIELGGRALMTYFDATEVADWSDIAQLADELKKADLFGQLFTTKSSRLGLGPCRLEPGDKVVVLADCCSPMVLRPHGLYHQVIGPCFVDGLMMGEVAEMVQRGEAKLERISIC